MWDHERNGDWLGMEIPFLDGPLFNNHSYIQLDRIIVHDTILLIMFC